LLTQDAADLGCSSSERGVGVWFHLILAVDECHVRKANKAEDEPEIRFLKIKGLWGCLFREHLPVQ
jgi:hypothetical protein